MQIKTVPEGEGVHKRVVMVVFSKVTNLQDNCDRMK